MCVCRRCLSPPRAPSFHRTCVIRAAQVESQIPRDKSRHDRHRDVPAPTSPDSSDRRKRASSSSPSTGIIIPPRVHHRVFSAACINSRGNPRGTGPLFSMNTRRAGNSYSLVAFERSASPNCIHCRVSVEVGVVEIALEIEDPRTITRIENHRTNLNFNISRFP